MRNDQLNKFIWIIDTLNRFKRLTLREIDRRWRLSQLSTAKDGLSRRTFYNYRANIEEIFGIEIKFDSSTNEYYIDDPRSGASTGASVLDILLNTASTNSVLSNTKEIADRIVLEDVPSAREHLSVVMEAVKGNYQLEFDYAPYTRVNPSKGVVIEPYFMNLFRQRWYVTGKNILDNKIKTYALDRMVNAGVLTNTFSFPDNFDTEEYSRYAFGVIFSLGEIYEVKLRVESRMAKYLRTLPMHHSQREEVMDGYSLFLYKLRLTPDLVAEILSLGKAVKVLEPSPLRLMVINELKGALDNYQ